MPVQVDDVTQASDRVAAPTETVTFNAGAKASSTGVNALDKSPILNLTGDKVGSYWGHTKNLIYEVADMSKVGTLTETATSAAVVITDADNNLELLFEIASGNRRYILKAIDSDGSVLYGWIGGVAASGNAYTIDIHNAVTSGAQSWVGTLADFDNTDIGKIEVYSYQSSFTWVTGTVLTTEVAAPSEEILDSPLKTKEYFDSLSAGEYGVNYRTGAIYFKKATTGTSDTCDYNTMASSSVTISESGGSATLVDDSAFTVASSAVTPVGYFADETAPDSVDEGDIGAARMTLDRKQLTASEQILGTATYTEATTYGSVLGVVRNDALAALADTDNEIAPLQVGATGALFVQGAYAEDAAHSSGDYGHQIFAVRNDAGTSLVDTDGDYAPLMVNASGMLNINFDQLRDTAPDVNLGAASAGTLRVALATDSAGMFAEDTAHTTADVGAQVLAVRNDTLASLCDTDGDYTPLQVGAAGALYVDLATKLDATNDSISTQPVEPSNINTSAAATSLVIKASAGTIYEIRGHNDNAAAQYIQVHDASSLPADTAVPEDSFIVAANSNFSISYPQGKSCATGIVVTNSSTLATKTIGGADCWFSAEYI
tara:strand:+ start:11448 stop:13253 length:1806 start_codon:yes stop_codon:yes gene_type:complete